MHINSTDIESSFIQSIKEADQLKHKSSIINAMSIEMHKQLWNSLVQSKDFVKCVCPLTTFLCPFLFIAFKVCLNHQKRKVMLIRIFDSSFSLIS